MKALILLLQEAAPAAGGSGMSMLIMFALVFVVMYFFMIRPQQKRQKELNNFRKSPQKGDKIVTAGGIYGTIVELKDTYALIEVDNNVKLRVDKSTIMKDITDIQSK